MPGNLSPEIPSRSERSMLFVPATRRAMIEKAARSEADAVCIDLEDSVADDQKAAARAEAIAALRELDFGHRTRMIRINGLDTPYAYRDLVDVVEAAGDRIDTVMLPKAGGADHVTFVDRLLTQIERHRGWSKPIGVEAQIESAAGFLWVREIAAASPRLEALIFGPGDYAASMRMPASVIGVSDEHDAAYPGHRWHAVMHAIVAAARAYGLRAIDGPFAAYRDAAGLERSARVARVLGFEGKQCIHPDQLGVVNAVFSPTEAEVAQARKVVEACEQAAATGQGAVGQNGVMIDAASVRMARTILEQSHRINRRSSS
jgi:citrate lyase subunit beta/citryl-CoA lyase